MKKGRRGSARVNRRTIAPQRLINRCSLRTDETLASVTDKSSESTENFGVIDDDSSTTPELDSTSTSQTETTTDLTTTLPTTETPIDSENLHSQEPNLPVDLLSEDILLDPNVVLARVARDLDALESAPRYRYYRRPLRRSDQQGNYNRQENRNTYNRPIYPVFPGKK